MVLMTTMTVSLVLDWYALLSFSSSSFVLCLLSRVLCFVWSLHKSFLVACRFLVISFMLGFKGVVYTTGGPVAYPAHIQNIKGLEATPACFSRLCSRAKGSKELSRGD
jgi:hypothetical protein